MHSPATYPNLNHPNPILTSTSKPCLDSLTVLWCCDQPKCPHFAGRMQVFGTKKYKNTQRVHTHKHTQRLLILMSCCCCFRPWDHPFLRASPPLLFIILYWSIYHTASHWFIHQAVSNPTAASHTQECTLYNVRAGLVMMNYAWGYSGTVCVTNNSLLLPIFGKMPQRRAIVSFKDTFLENLPAVILNIKCYTNLMQSATGSLLVI